jgi:hypothetical protein
MTEFHLAERGRSTILACVDIFRNGDGSLRRLG